MIYGAAGITGYIAAILFLFVLVVAASLPSNGANSSGDGDSE